jgi:hypothetical protein
MSALNEEGVMAVRSAACDRLLASRVDLKLKVTIFTLQNVNLVLLGLASYWRTSRCTYIILSCMGWPSPMMVGFAWPAVSIVM